MSSLAAHMLACFDVAVGTRLLIVVKRHRLSVLEFWSLEDRNFWIELPDNGFDMRKSRDYHVFAGPIYQICSFGILETKLLCTCVREGQDCIPRYNRWWSMA